MIKLQNVGKSFACGTTLDLLRDPLEVQALEGVSLELSPGECLHITGPSGAGKTVLVSLLAGLYEPDEGTVRVFQQDPVTSVELQKRMALVRPGENNFDPRVSARRNLDILAGLYGLAGQRRQQQVNEALSFFELEDPLRRLPYGELSPGIKNLIALAAGLVVSPDCLLLDAPDRFLDRARRRKLKNTLRGLHSEGVTIVLSAEGDELVSHLDRRCLVLEGGSVSEYYVPE